MTAEAGGARRHKGPTTVRFSSQNLRRNPDILQRLPTQLVFRIVFLLFCNFLLLGEISFSFLVKSEICRPFTNKISIRFSKQKHLLTKQPVLLSLTSMEPKKYTTETDSVTVWQHLFSECLIFKGPIFCKVHFVNGFKQ